MYVLARYSLLCMVIQVGGGWMSDFDVIPAARGCLPFFNGGRFTLHEG